MSELKKQSFDRQHLEMTGEEKESRTIDAETDSGIYDPLATSEVTTDANRTRNADRDAEADSGIYDPLATSEVTTDANRTRNVDRARICKWISDHKKTSIFILLIFVIVLLVIVTCDTKKDSRIDDPSATSEVMTDANGTRNADSGKDTKKDSRIDDPSATSEVMTDANGTRNADSGKVKEKSHPSSAPGESSACPESWHSYKGKCFYAPKEQRSWLMSYDNCFSLNASLAVVDTKQDLDHLGEVFNLPDYWIGLSKTDQVWKWSDGTVFIKQFPVEGEGACAYVNRKGVNSTICSVEKRYICSIPKHCRKAE